MQNTYINSRSVINNRTFKQSIEHHYDKHKQQLQHIKNRRSDFELYEHQHLDYVKRKMGQKSQIERVQKEFNPARNEDKSLVRHIKGIVERNQGNQGKHGKHRQHGGGSLAKKEEHRISSITEYHRSHAKTMEAQKEQIKKQNKILSQKIAQHSQNKLTKKELRRQFKVYQSQRNLLRKVHYESEKPKMRRERSIDVLDRREREHME